MQKSIGNFSYARCCWAEGYFLSPYCSFDNNPVIFFDPNGADSKKDYMSIATVYSYRYVKEGVHQIISSETITVAKYKNNGVEISTRTISTTTTVKVVDGENDDFDFDISSVQTISGKTELFDIDQDDNLLKKGEKDVCKPIKVNELNKAELDGVDPKNAGYTNGLTKFISDNGENANPYNTRLPIDEAIGGIGAASSLAKLSKTKKRIAAAIGVGYYVASLTRTTNIGSFEGRSHVFDVEHNDYYLDSESSNVKENNSKKDE